MPLSLRECAYQHIRQKILSGEVPPDRRLSEVALAKEIGISRTPVREAVTQLASEGLVHRDPELGVLVRQITRDELPNCWTCAGCSKSTPPPAPCGATAADVAQFRAIIERLRKISRAIRDEGMASWDRELGRRMGLTDILYHMAILRTADSPRVMKIIDDFHVLTTRYRPPGRNSLPVLAATLLEHWRIFRAIARATRKPHWPRCATTRGSCAWRAWRRTSSSSGRPSRTPVVTDWTALLDRMLGADGDRQRLDPASPCTGRAANYREGEAPAEPRSTAVSDRGEPLTAARTEPRPPGRNGPPFGGQGITCPSTGKAKRSIKPRTRRPASSRSG